MLQPPGFAIKSKEHWILLLLRAICGLKQSRRSWYQNIEAYLLHLNLLHTYSYHNLYYLHNPNQWVLLILYVEDIFTTGNDPSRVHWLCDKLQSK